MLFTWYCPNIRRNAIIIVLVLLLGLIIFVFPKLVEMFTYPMEKNKQDYLQERPLRVMFEYTKNI